MIKNSLFLLFFLLNSFIIIGQNNSVDYAKVAALTEAKNDAFLQKAINSKDSLAMAYGYGKMANLKSNDPNLRLEVVELSLRAIELFENRDEVQKNWFRIFLANQINENSDSKLSLEYAGVLADSVLRYCSQNKDPNLKMAALQVMLRIGPENTVQKMSKDQVIKLCDGLFKNKLIYDIGFLKMHYYASGNVELNRNLVKADSLFGLCKKYALLQNDTLIIAHCTIIESYINRMQEQYQVAINNIKNNISDKLLKKYPELAKWVYQEMAQNYVALKDYKVSNQYWDLYFKKTNELAAGNLNKYKLSELINNYLAKKQVIENDILQKRNLVNLETSKKYKYLIIILLLVLFAGISFVFFRIKWNNMKDKNLVNSILLEGQELERSKLSKELHDGVGSSLAALKTNLYLTEKTNENSHLLTLVDDLYLKVRDISHQIYPTFLITDGLVFALNDYIEFINKEKKINFTFFGDEPKIEQNKLLNIFRTLQELLNNALKHANASKIDIELLFKNREIFIRVQDNGIGFDPNNVSSGLGLKNIINRIESINGHLERISEPGNGSTFLISIQN